MIGRLAVVALVAVAACRGDHGPRWKPAGASGPRRGGEVRFALPAQIATLDPAIANDDTSVAAIHALFDTLLDFADDGYDLVPRLAEALPEVGDGGRTYTFHLRAGLTYADGTPIRAEDVRGALERPRTLADSPFAALVANATFAAPDARTLVVTLATPDVTFPYIMTMSFTAPQPAGRPVSRTQPAASGPYMLERWSEGERCVLVKNPHYYAPATRGFLDRITLIENIAPDVGFLMFERGEVDAVDKLTAPDQLWLARQPAWAPYVHTRALPVAYGSRMDTQRAPFADRRVRQALNYAVDKQHEVRLLHGTAVAAHGLLPPGMLGRDDGLAPYPHDPAKARALLAEAGYAHGFDATYVIPTDDDAETLAASLAGDLAEVGVRVTIQRVTLATFTDATNHPEAVPFAQAGWLGDYPDPSAFLDAKLHSRAIGPGNSNDARYANPALDALLDEARRTVDAGARAALYRRAERIVYDDAPWIFGYHQLAIVVVQPYLRGAEPHPIWAHDFTHAWLDVGPDGKPVPR